MHTPCATQFIHECIAWRVNEEISCMKKCLNELLSRILPIMSYAVNIHRKVTQCAKQNYFKKAEKKNINAALLSCTNWKSAWGRKCFNQQFRRVKFRRRTTEHELALKGCITKKWISGWLVLSKQFGIDSHRIMPSALLWTSNDFIIQKRFLKLRTFVVNFT